jgi:hypothetical protein
MQQLDIWFDVRRAWVLIKVKDDPGAVANRILGLNEGWRDAYHGVIRADVIERNAPYHIVVSLYVKANDDDRMGYIHERIAGVEGVSEAVLLPVQTHYPVPPHDTHGYISDEEARMVDPVAGPQGINAWG